MLPRVAPAAPGDSAGSGGAGGQGAGGGAFNDAGSSMSLSGSLITLNSASGGAGGTGGSSGAGGSGGDGFGGGVYNAAPDDSFPPGLPGAALSLTDVLVTLNAADGGSGGRGTTRGDEGQGMGGGLYLAAGGTATLTRTHVVLNVASTSDPDIFGTTS